MEKIVQLREYEYNQLVKTANLNEDQIKELAERYYQERGVFKINITAELKESYDSHLNYIAHSFSTENGLYKQGEFKPIIPEKGRRKIEQIMEDIAEEIFRRKFGDVVEARNFYQTMRDKFFLIRWICYTIAISGWTVATVLAIKTLF